MVLVYLGHRCKEGSGIVPWYFAGSLSLEPGQRFDIPPAGLTIGRGRDAAVRVASNGVARLHARLTPSPDGRTVRIEDLGTTNGTQIAGESVTGGDLEAGDRFTLALSFDFELQAA